MIVLLYPPSRLFPEVDRGGSPPTTGSGGDEEHGHRVGEAGAQLTSMPKRTKGADEDVTCDVQRRSASSILEYIPSFSVFKTDQSFFFCFDVCKVIVFVFVFLTCFNKHDGERISTI